MSQNLELVKFLLSKGVDPNESRMGHRAFIDIAGGYSTLEIVKTVRRSMGQQPCVSLYRKDARVS
jgi:hypothetical protein